MSSKKYNVVIDSISSVFGDWHLGYAVDVHIHREEEMSGKAVGHERVRVPLDRDRLIKPGGDYDMDAVAAMVAERIGTTEVCWEEP